jgi:transforming growth factor-beta-induced protein
MSERWRDGVAAGCALLLWLAAPPAGAADLVETARSTKSEKFRIDHFAIALEAAGLAPSLSQGAYTVFAPTNQALRRLDLDALEPGGPALSPEAKLRAADPDRLAAVLKAHIVEGAIPYTELVGRPALETEGGTTLEVKPTEGGVMINGITLAKPDLMADNGVIHVIEGLLAGGAQR